MLVDVCGFQSIMSLFQNTKASKVQPRAAGRKSSCGCLSTLFTLLFIGALTLAAVFAVCRFSLVRCTLPLRDLGSVVAD